MCMNKNIIIILCTLLSIFQSCRKHPDIPVPPNPEDINMTLVYAVNHNNLYQDLIENKRQISKVASLINNDTDKVLIYYYTDGVPTLQEMKYANGVAEFVDVKKYSKDLLSVDSDRMSEVIDDVISLYPKAQKNLFLWGHGVGPVNPSKYYRLPSQMMNADGGEKTLATPEKPELYGFGGEYVSDTDHTSIYIDLDEMADAIPNSVFNTIWFDCCYMGSIEVAYQLRNKCRYLVAYPTEIMSEGLPYDRVLLYIVGSNQNLVKGAEELYDYYNLKGQPVTVTVMDMNHIGDFADAVRNYVQILNNKPTFAGVIDYSRLYLGRPNNAVKHPYYDLISWLSNADLTQSSDKVKLDEVVKIYNKFVIKAYGYQDFYYNVFDQSKFFGISVYNFNNENSDRDIYYRKLDWYNDVAKYANWLQ